MAKLPIQNLLSDEHLAGIGLVVVQWANLERNLKFALRQLAKFPAESGMIVTAGMDNRTVNGLLRTLITRKLGADEEKTFGVLVREIERLKGQRDVIAHSTWAKGSEPGFVKPCGIKAVGKLKTVTGESEPKGFHGTATEIREVTLGIIEFFQSHGYMLEFALPPADRGRLRGFLQRAAERSSEQSRDSLPPTPHNKRSQKQ